MKLTKQVQPLFFSSLAVAVIACLGPQILFRCFGVDIDIPMRHSLWLTVLWLLMFGVGIVRYGGQGLWLLIGAPLALLYPCFYAMILLSCAHNVNACP